METVLCEKCGSPMVSYLEEHTCGYKCPKCDNGWATTYFSPIETDTTTYDIVISVAKTPSAEQIRTVSKIAHCNFISSKTLLINGGKIMSAKANEIIDSTKDLRKAGVSFSIKPDFPYDL